MKISSLLPKRIVLAFDIERAGPTADYDTIAIGASVVDQDFKILDEIFLPGYFPRHDSSANNASTQFETDCWNSFWSKHTDQLSQLEYHGASSLIERQSEMIISFQEFRKKWEKWAENNKYTYELCTDNNVFDGGFINRMINLYAPEYNPIPFAATPLPSGKHDYCPFWETHSMQRGLLFQVDPTFTDNSGYSDKIKELYDLPDTISTSIHHDHLPHHDAYTIACDLQILHGIREGRIQRRKEAES